MSYQLANGDLISQTRGGSTTYYLPDGQGSTRALADVVVNMMDAVPH